MTTMFSEIGDAFFRDDLRDDAIEDAEDVVVRDERGFLALEIFIGCTIGENDAREPARRRDLDGRDVATAMETFPAVPRPTGFAVIRIDTGAGKEFFRRLE